MGVETAIAIGAGSSLLGAGLQYGENRAARKRATAAGQQAQQIAGSPLGADSEIRAALNSQTNSGQDSYLQFLRSDPSALKPFSFDASQAFQALQAKDAQTINDQSLALSAGAGSLGSRFGSGFASKSALLRGRFASDIASRNAGIAQSSFNTALGAGMQDFQFGRQQGASQKLGLLQLLQSGQLGQRQQQLQALGFSAGLPMPGIGAQIGQTGNDLASLLMIGNYFKGQQGAQGWGNAVTPRPVQTIQNSAGF